MSKTYVIIPAYNEEKRLPTILKVMTQCIGKKIIDKVIVIDDASKDRTNEIIEEFSKKNKSIMNIRLKRNIGMGGAIMKAIDVINRNADAEVIAKIDADLKGLTPKHIEKLIKPIKTNDSSMTMAEFSSVKNSGMRAYRADIILPLVCDDKYKLFLRDIGSKFDTALMDIYKHEHGRRELKPKVVRWEGINHIFVRGFGYRSSNLKYNPRAHKEQELFNNFFSETEIKRRTNKGNHRRRL